MSENKEIKKSETTAKPKVKEAPDFKRVVVETVQAIDTKITDLENNMKTEANPLKYIELKAVLESNKMLKAAIFEMVNTFKTTVSETDK